MKSFHRRKVDMIVPDMTCSQKNYAFAAKLIIFRPVSIAYL